MWRCALLVLSLVAGCMRGHARGASPYADAARDCRSAAALLAPAREPTPHMAQPLWRVRACPDRAGGLLATALRAARAEADTGRLEARTWLAHYVHDARLLAAGLAVAGDTLAAPAARVAALRVLLWSKAPGHAVPLRHMVEGPPCVPARCQSSYTGHYYGGGPVLGDTARWPVFGAPMPAGYAATIDSAAGALAVAPRTPPAVRAAARVVRRFPPDPELRGR